MLANTTLVLALCACVVFVILVQLPAVLALTHAKAQPRFAKVFEATCRINGSCADLLMCGVCGVDDAGRGAGQEPGRWHSATHTQQQVWQGGLLLPQRSCPLCAAFCALTPLHMPAMQPTSSGFFQSRVAYMSCLFNRAAQLAFGLPTHGIKVLCCCVHGFVGLQLIGGQLVTINAKLVKKQRFHFTTLQGLDVDIIAGLNGLIWVSPHVPRAEDGTPVQQQQQQQQGGELIDSAAAVAAAAAVAQGPSKDQREAVVRVAGAIRALAALMLQVYPGSIIEAYQVGEA